MANLEHYRKIVEEFCEIAHVQDAAGLFENGQLNVHGVDMLLFYDEEFDPERLQIRIDLKKPPHAEKGAETLLIALLASNYSFGMGGYFVFGINPHDGHVVLTLQQMIDIETTGRNLLEILQGVALQAKSQWQQICEEVEKKNRSSPSRKFVKV